MASSLLKRRQIRDAHACAVATAYLLLRAVTTFRNSHPARILERVRTVGARLVAAQPREMVVGNIVRRVLGVIRDEADSRRLGVGDRDPLSLSLSLAQSSTASDAGTRPHTPPGPASTTTTTTNTTATAGARGGGGDGLGSGGGHSHERAIYEAIERSTLRAPAVLPNAPVTAPPAISMFRLLAHDDGDDGSVASSTPPPTDSPSGRLAPPAVTAAADATAEKHSDLRAEVIDGIHEIIDELGQVNDQIAAYALEHIHSNEVVLTYAASRTVHSFLLKAAAKRRFTVIHAEAYPNHHLDVHAAATGGGRGAAADDDADFSPEALQKSLADFGVTVILIPDSAVFALMARVNKVVLGTHSVLANGGLVAAAGTRVVANAARLHRVPVVVVSGIYKLSPVYPFDYEALVEYGGAGAVLEYGGKDGKLVGKVDVGNPLFDYVPAELVDLYITNLWVLLPGLLLCCVLTAPLRGGHAPSYLYRIVSDHYRQEDMTL